MRALTKCRSNSGFGPDNHSSGRPFHLDQWEALSSSRRRRRHNRKRTTIRSSAQEPPPTGQPKIYIFGQSFCFSFLNLGIKGFTRVDSDIWPKRGSASHSRTGRCGRRGACASVIARKTTIHQQRTALSPKPVGARSDCGQIQTDRGGGTGGESPLSE